MRRRGRRKRNARAVTTGAADAAAAVAAVAIAASSDGGGLRAALARNRRLGIEAVALAAFLVVAGFLVFHFFVKTIKNTRPLGGVNMIVTHGHDGTENEAAFAVDPARPSVIFGASNELRSYTSVDAGRTWRGD